MDLITLALAKQYTDEQTGGGGGAEGAVKYNEAQTLTETEFNQVMSNLQLGCAKNSSIQTVLSETNIAWASAGTRYVTTTGFISTFGVVEYDIEMTVENTSYSFSVTPTLSGASIIFSNLSSLTGGYISAMWGSGTALQATATAACTVNSLTITTHDAITIYTPIDSNLVPETIYTAGTGISISDKVISNTGTVGYPLTNDSSFVVNLAWNKELHLTTQLTSQALSLNIYGTGFVNDSAESRVLFETGTLSGATFALSVLSAGVSLKWANSEPLVLSDNTMYELSLTSFYHSNGHRYILASYNTYDLT